MTAVFFGVATLLYSHSADNSVKYLKLFGLIFDTPVPIDSDDAYSYLTYRFLT